MSEPPSKSTRPTSSSLWTTPAGDLTRHPLQQASVDRNVSAEEIRSAVTAARSRAAAFDGKVSDDVLRSSVE